MLHTYCATTYANLVVEHPSAKVFDQFSLEKATQGLSNLDDLIEPTCIHIYRGCSFASCSK